jgi:ParB/RepB/Spo0J family partition protein
MTAEAKSIESGYYENFDIGLIDPSPKNNRDFSLNQNIEELANNIKEVGLLQPVMGRPSPTSEGRIELVLGERRLRASKLAGLKTIRLTIQDLTDEAAHTATIAENMQREDLSPFEESRGVESMLDTFRGDYEAVASKLGRTVHWVRNRAKLGNLSEKWKEEIKPGNEGSTFGVGHLELVARFPAEIQDRWLDENDGCLLDYSVYGTVKDLHTSLEEMLSVLDVVPFDKSDCQKCNKRSDRGGQIGLFDFNDEGDPVKGVRCLDRECFDNKVEGFIKERFTDLKKTHKKLVALSVNPMCFNRRNHYQEMLESPIYHDHEFTDSDPDEDGALPAMIVYGGELGKLIFIKASNEEKRAVTTTGKPAKTLAQKKDELDRKRWTRVLQILGDEIDKKEEGDLAKGVNIVALAACFGTASIVTYSKGWEDYRKMTSFEVAVSSLYDAVKPCLKGLFYYCGPVTQLPDTILKHGKAVAALYEINLDEIYEQVAKMKGFTVPKSWAKLEESEAKNG